MPMQMPEKPAPTMSTWTEMSEALLCLPEGSGMLPQSYTRWIPARSMPAQEFRGFTQGLVGFGEYLRCELPDMGNDRPDFQFNRNACGASVCGHASRIVAQTFVGAHVDQQRRKAGRVRVAQVVARARTNVCPVEHGAASSVRSDGFAGGGQVGPGRKQRCGSRKRRTRPSKC